MLVRCSALHQIKSYDPQLKKFTVNSLDFRLCNITYQVEGFGVSFRLLLLSRYNTNPQRSGCGLLGKQPPFESHTLVLQSQYIMIQSFCLNGHPLYFYKFHLYI
jgi:hypothetical protein